MAVDKLVDSAQLNSDLTSIANAIRAKGGTSAQLAFPSDFVSAIGNIPSGGGGISADDVATGSVTGDIVLTDAVTSIIDYAFYSDEITSVSAPEVLTIGPHAFGYCSNLTTVSFPKVTRVGQASSGTTSAYVFRNTKVETFYFPELISAYGDYVFGNVGDSSHMAIFVAPKLTNVNQNIFRNGYWDAIDLGVDFATLPNQCFYGGSLSNVILRRTSSIVSAPNANSINAIKSDTKVYVPSTLIATYKADSTWSSKSSCFYAIEGSDYEHYYADGTPIN